MRFIAPIALMMFVAGCALVNSQLEPSPALVPSVPAWTEADQQRLDAAWEQLATGEEISDRAILIRALTEYGNVRLAMKEAKERASLK